MYASFLYRQKDGIKEKTLGDEWCIQSNREFKIDLDN